MDKAFDSGGSTFALCTAILVLMAIGIQLWGAQEDSAQYAAIQRYGLPNIIAMVALVAGGFAPKSMRISLWIAFVVVLIIAGLLATGDWGIRPGHLFFGAIAGCALRAFRATAFERLGAVAAIAVLAFVGASLDGVTMLIAVDVVLLVSIIAEHARIERPHQTPAAV